VASWGAGLVSGAGRQDRLVEQADGSGGGQGGLAGSQMEGRRGCCVLLVFPTCRQHNKRHQSSWIMIPVCLVLTKLFLAKN